MKVYGEWHIPEDQERAWIRDSPLVATWSAGNVAEKRRLEDRRQDRS